VARRPFWNSRSWFRVFSPGARGAAPCWLRAVRARVSSRNGFDGHEGRVGFGNVSVVMECECSSKPRARRLLSSAGMRFQAPRCVGQGLHELFLDHADWFEVDEETMR